MSEARRWARRNVNCSGSSFVHGMTHAPTRPVTTTAWYRTHQPRTQHRRETRRNGARTQRHTNLTRVQVNQQVMLKMSWSMSFESSSSSTPRVLPWRTFLVVRSCSRLAPKSRTTSRTGIAREVEDGGLANGDGQGDGLNRAGRVRERRRGPVAQCQRGSQGVGRRGRASVLRERGCHLGRALANGPLRVVRVCLPGGRFGVRDRADTRRGDVARPTIRPPLRQNEGEEGRYD